MTALQSLALSRAIKAIRAADALLQRRCSYTSPCAGYLDAQMQKAQKELRDALEFLDALTEEGE